MTYEIVTNESAEIGDAESRGYIAPGGWRDDEPVEMTLREAIRLCAPQEDADGWFTEVDGRIDYRTGAVETRAIHPPRNITPSSYARIRALLGFS